MATKTHKNPNNLRTLQRHITAHNDKSEAIFSDALSSEAPIRSVMGGDMTFSLMYTTSKYPVSMNGDKDIEGYQDHLKTPPAIVVPGGTVCRTVDFPPEFVSPMHRTVSLDYGVVLEGEIELILDSGESRILKRGDVAVQRGTNHAWKNTSTENWARMLYVLQSSEAVVVNGKPMDHDEGGID
ncbi:hypothetical protein LTR84_000754 [Exophiala bonariae]|uniref:Cupin type-2 domain-containing protein n=1 Tax=Exophiala bonariae TaxID=1690606 RepID=A0AAV9NVH2_9EURO|nr:hypothetical protein LTR84_000754 [Exophiala bonariae]